jgi:hypothetical protein
MKEFEPDNLNKREDVIPYKKERDYAERKEAVVNKHVLVLQQGRN